MEFYNQGIEFNLDRKPTIKEYKPRSLQNEEQNDNLKKPAVSYNNQNLQPKNVEKKTVNENAKKINASTEQTDYGDLNDLQISFLHTRASLIVIIEYLNSIHKTNLSLDQWKKIHPLVLNGKENITTKQKDHIMKFINMNFLKIRATNTIEGKGGVKEWLSNNDWNLDVSKINPKPNDVIVLARSTINGMSWKHDLLSSNWMKKTVMEKKFVKSNTKGFSSLQINNGDVYTDGLGHNLGIYNLNFKDKKLSIRITDLTYSSSTFENVLYNHRNKEGWIKNEKVAGFCFMPFKINLNASTMRTIQGGEINAWKILAIAGDGFIEIDKNEPCNYSLKTFVYGHFRCMPKVVTFNNLINLFRKKDGQIIGNFLVELLLDDEEILAVMGNQDNFKSINLR